MKRDSQQIMRWLVITSWLLYATTFFPFKFPKEYLVQWVFVFVAFSSILIVSALALLKRGWRTASALAAIALLAVYASYWISLTATARETKPNLPSPVALGYILEQGALIASHLWGRGARLGAAQIAYFEIVMPIVQILLLLWIAMGAKVRRGN